MMHEMISTRVAYGEALAALGEINEKVSYKGRIQF